MTDEDLPFGYPAHWEADIVLRDGSVAHLRPIRPGDGDAIRVFHSKQSAESIYLRFFAPLKELSDKDVHRFTHVDYIDRVALVCTLAGEIIGIGRYDRVAPQVAEVAFNISDHYHGKGIGSVLLEHLAAIAQEFGITRFTAEVLPQNRKMLRVFSDAGYQVSRRVEDGIVQVDFDIHETSQSRAVALSREHRAESVSVGALITPSSVAVIGADRDPDGIGHRILANILDYGFTGEVYPVNAKADEILGRPAYPSVTAVPGQVDIAVVAVPARSVLKVVNECAQAGVKGLLVVSAGFAEADSEPDGPGTQLQLEVLRVARLHGMRVVGPNSFGIINNDPDTRLNATLAPTIPARGHLGLFAQSGALGIAILASAADRRLGISSFASAGNRIDVSGNDFMQFWIDDDETQAVGLYLESMGNPRKFNRIARNLAARKPVMVIKSAVSAYGVPPGHRVRKTKVRPQVFDAMLRQAGVIRVSDVHQLFDVAQLVLHQPLPSGRRIGIVSNSSALAALTAEAAVGWGLKVATKPKGLPPDANAEQCRAALDAAFADPKVDSVVACFVPPVVTLDEEIAQAVRESAADATKPIVTTFLGMRGVDVGRAVAGSTTGTEDRGIPVYSTPEDAVRALAAATRYGQWRAKDKGTDLAPPGIQRAAAEDIVHTVLSVAPKGRELTADETGAVLQAYGITPWPAVRVGSPDEAVDAARRLGYPVVLKSVADVVRAQGGVGGVRIDLASEQAVRDAWHSLTERLGPSGGDEYVVQRMATPGVATVITAEEDPLFGPVVSFSLAGLPTELLGDIAYRIPPLTDVDVHELVTSIKGFPVLDGHKGAPPVAVDVLEDIIGRIAELADELPEISSLALNPVNVHPGGVEVLGARIVVRPAPRRKDPGRRSLT